MRGDHEPRRVHDPQPASRCDDVADGVRHRRETQLVQPVGEPAAARAFAAARRGDPRRVAHVPAAVSSSVSHVSDGAPSRTRWHAGDTLVDSPPMLLPASVPAAFDNVAERDHFATSRPFRRGPMQQQDLIHDWNTAATPSTIAARPVELDDETLRDGLQCPSVTDPPIAAKIEILHLMCELGIHTADIGLPGAGPRAEARRAGARARDRRARCRSRPTARRARCARTSSRSRASCRRRACPSRRARSSARRRSGSMPRTGRSTAC
jgi:hypothetical protein